MMLRRIRGSSSTTRTLRTLPCIVAPEPHRAGHKPATMPQCRTEPSGVPGTIPVAGRDRAGLGRQHDAADDVPGLEVGERRSRLGERSGRERDRTDEALLAERDELLELLERAHLRALDRDAEEGKERDRHLQGAAEEADDDELAALPERARAEAHGGLGTDEVDRRRDAAAGRLDELLDGTLPGRIDRLDRTVLERRLP